MRRTFGFPCEDRGTPCRHSCHDISFAFSHALKNTHISTHRRHPCFDPLPHPSALRPSPSSPFNRRNGSLSSIPVETAADLTLFRQESWEWDALHVVGTAKEV